jgi:hypothetical protein
MIPASFMRVEIRYAYAAAARGYGYFHAARMGRVFFHVGAYDAYAMGPVAAAVFKLKEYPAAAASAEGVPLTNTAGTAAARAEEQALEEFEAKRVFEGADEDVRLIPNFETI